VKLSIIMLSRNGFVVCSYFKLGLD